MNTKFGSGKARTIGQSIVYPLPIPLDPAPYVGAVVAGESEEGDINLYFSDGTEWRQHIAESTITELVEVLISEITLQGYAEEDLPNPTNPENERRFAFNETKGLPGFVWEDEWRYLADESRVTEIAESVVSDVARLMPPDLLITLSNVGPEIEGVHYTSINRALQFATGFLRNHNASNPFGRRTWIKMLSGYKLDEQVIVIGIDAANVSIVAEDAVVEVDMTAMTTQTSGEILSGIEYCHDTFYGFDAVMPQFLGVIFEPDGGTIPQDAVTVGQVGAYTPRSRGVFMDGATSASIVFRETDETGDPITRRAAGFRGFWANAFGDAATRVDLRGVDFDNGGYFGARLLGVSRIEAVVARGCGTEGSLRLGGQSVFVKRGSGADGTFPGVFSQDFRRTPGVDSTTDIILETNARVSINPLDTHFRGGFSIPFGTLTNSGFVAGFNRPLRTYNRDNVVGTVSQAGGVPTGAVLEGGTNSNGQYFRLANGWQVCTTTILSSNAGSVTWTFPAAFADSKVDSVSVMPLTANPRVTGAQYTSATSMELHLYDLAGARQVNTMEVIAIGRWY